MASFSSRGIASSGKQTHMQTNNNQCHQSANNWSFQMELVHPERSPVLQDFQAMDPPPAASTISPADLQTRIPGVQIDMPSRLGGNAHHFSRQDESADSHFYTSPRLVTHIDDYAVSALTRHYTQHLAPNSSILDICTSWISHLPASVNSDEDSGSSQQHQNAVVGVGMNEHEMKCNKALTAYHVHDLNTSPSMPFLLDASFDHALCCVSIDYLIHPHQLFAEINRVLKPGGSFILSFSNRCFPTKAILAWLLTGDTEHLYIVSTYFHLTGGWDKVQIQDLTDYDDEKGEYTDPLYVIQGYKEA